MAIRVTNGFEVRSANPIDTRLVLTKEQMASINELLMPDKYIALCTDDSKLYIFDKSIEPNVDTGKFRLYEAPVDAEDMAIKLPGALLKAMENQPEDTASAVASTLPSALEYVMSTQEGAEQIVETMFNTQEFQAGVDNKIELALEVIQAIDSNK